MFISVDESGRAVRIPAGSVVSLHVDGPAEVAWQSAERDPGDRVAWSVSEAGDVLERVAVGETVWLWVALPEGGEDSRRRAHVAIAKRS